MAYTPSKAAAEHFRAIAPKYMRMLMADFDLSDLDAAAVFGNAGHESLGFTLLQEQKPTVAGSRGGYGWFQWTGPRRKEFEAYCARNRLSPASHEANYKFLFVELKGPEKRSLRALKEAVSLDSKTVAFEEAFERSGVKHYDRRKAWAAVALDALRQSPVGTKEPPAKPPTPADPPLPRTDQPRGNGGLFVIIALLVSAIGGAIIAFFQNGGSP